MNYFAKFEKFWIIIPSFMTVESLMPELDRWGAFFVLYKIGSQNPPYKPGLRGEGRGRRGKARHCL